jgi:AraC family transcriptional regulator, transcriptional activator of the genes for pyochelin and ferripyochelin receptors
MEFQLIAPGSSELQIIEALPSTFTGHILPAPHAVEVKSAFGNMVFQQYKGDGFTIWYSNYNILHPTELIGRGDVPVLELHMQFLNDFSTQWDGVGEKLVRCYQYNLTYTPFVFNRASFAGGHEYHTFDVHFTLPFLEHWAPHFPVLHNFLDMVHKGQPTTIFEKDHYLSHSMIDIVQNVLLSPFTGHVLQYYIQSKVIELLLAALEQASNIHPLAPVKLSAYDIDRLHEAKDLLLKDFDNPLSIMQLARILGINDNKLKKGFKHLFGQTIFSYVQTERMTQARKAILETDSPIEHIAYLAGYGHVSNFKKAFQKHFGYSASYLRRNKKN